MPDFTITFTRVLKLNGTITIKARSTEDAEAKVDDIMNRVMEEQLLTWTIEPSKIGKAKALTVEWEEESDDIEDITIEEG